MVHFKDVVDLRGQGTRGWAGVLVVVKHKEKGEEASEEHDTVKERQCTIRELRCINLTGKGTDGWLVGWANPLLFSSFFFLSSPCLCSAVYQAGKVPWLSS